MNSYPFVLGDIITSHGVRRDAALLDLHFVGPMIDLGLQVPHDAIFGAVDDL